VSIHPHVLRAAEGDLPDWTVAGERRRAHMTRVSDLMSVWADGLGLDEGDRVRWRAVGYLHDALRDEDVEVLRGRVPPELRHLPGPLLHGPAAAERLRTDGVPDGELLDAVAWHTAGHEDFGALGRALYAADFLEPGRAFLSEWRAELRARMPADLDGVAYSVAQARLANRVERGGTILPQTLAFWNRLAQKAS
jgi:HD superfamily phosphohydrolase YqeK